MMKPLPIFLGYDPKEHQAYTVARNSIERRASVPVLITPLYLPHLPMLHRPIEQKDGRLWCPISKAPMSTEFAISRFCVPFIQRDGWALFADSDILCLADIAELFARADDRYAVMVVKHNQESGTDTKMDGQAQTYYSRKNQSSVMLINCAHAGHYRLRAMDRLNLWPGRDLHAFKWLANNEIGYIPSCWNHLVNVTIDKDITTAKILHYTLGGPFLEGWQGANHDELWLNELKTLNINLVQSMP